MKPLAALAAIALLAVPGLARAQALQCSAPTVPQPVHADLPGKGEARRVVPIGGYTLAVTWVPEYCHGRGQAAGAQFECGGDNRFGFSLHGLWPDGVGKDWPQYCRDTALLPQAIIKRNLCSTPSAQLLQHEWAKHGTCTGLGADAYFARSTGMYARLHWPDMTALAARPSLTAGALAAAFAAANPGIRSDMLRITTNKGGWLDEIWFCFDRSFAFARCRPDSGGVAPATMLKVARLRT